MSDSRVVAGGGQEGRSREGLSQLYTCPSRSPQPRTSTAMAEGQKRRGLKKFSKWPWDGVGGQWGAHLDISVGRRMCES